MDREGFIDTVRRQYIEDIQEAYLECEHGGNFTLDLPRLKHLLARLMQNAQVDGLPRAEFEDILRTTLPHLEGQLDLPTIQKKAA